MNSLITLISTNQKSETPIKNSDSKGTEKDASTKDFMSILYAQIQDSAKKSTDSTATLSIDTLNDISTNIKKDDETKSTDEILLDEVLNIINQLKNGNETTENFPKFSDKMNKILNNETVKNDFKSVKNINDIVDLSKKYNLGLENIEISQDNIKNFKEIFPKLDSKKFFDTKNDKKIDYKTLENSENKKTPTTNKIIQNNLAKIPKKTDKTNKNILGNLLKEIDTQKAKEEITPKSNKSVKNLKKDDISLDNKKSIDTKQKTVNIEEKIESKSNKITEDLKQNIKNLDNSEKKLPKKTVDIKNLDAKDTKITLTNEIKQQKTDTQNIEKIKTKSNKVAEDLKQNIKNLDVKDTKITLTNEIKQQKTDTQKTNEDKILHKIKSQKQNVTLNLNSNQNSSTDHKKDEDSTTKPRETKTDSVNQKQEFKNSFQIDNGKTAKQVDSKTSLNQFTNDLKEKIDQYKSPIMKVKMTLNPKNLGEVDVTILSRGNNLHVNITSNTNTMSLFTQNQAEFKNSLVNMGFTNLEMNFSDQGQNQQNQQNSKKQNNSFEEFNQQEEHESSIELIVPRYV